MGIESLAEELEDATLLLAAGRQDRPDALAPLLSPFAAGALCDVAIDHDVPNRLLGLVVRRLHPRHCQEVKVIVRFAPPKAVGQSPGLRTPGRTPDRFKKPAADAIH